MRWTPRKAVSCQHATENERLTMITPFWEWDCSRDTGRCGDGDRCVGNLLPVQTSLLWMGWAARRFF